MWKEGFLVFMRERIDLRSLRSKNQDFPPYGKCHFAKALLFESLSNAVLLLSSCVFFMREARGKIASLQETRKSRFRKMIFPEREKVSFDFRSEAILILMSHIYVNPIRRKPKRKSRTLKESAASYILQSRQF